ncbi:hypothetical protein GALMADRAFT_151399 [Galerina marginata CBS 339.88]|uniref:F-box domain-containing protein n=1 Tax=Galerina marginata (strain CBS 339.88) TaxID=685588 RepID=A0A067TN13_GALM3|nr:hypothetical protein GALMADRAFT_151399 [Galerina marginata CBS 339.88]
MLDSKPPSSCVYPTNHSGPIVNLDNDTLWYIFSLNANMELHFGQPEDTVPALRTLRYISQVCSNWRQLAVGSPSLWSRILDVNLLSQGADWRNEVIRRTGTALLDVKAQNYDPSLPLALNSLEWLLNAHWSRIRSLVLALDHLHFSPDEEPWFRLFERPAPSMEIFIFLGEFVTPPTFVLFSNTAPSLRRLSAAHMRLNLTTFRTPKLCHLVIHSPVSTLDLLNALNQMPVLESLETGSLEPFIPVQDAQYPLPVATLPRLRQIKFEVLDCADVTLSVLAHILPAKGCVLGFFAIYQQEIPGDHGDIGTILSTYLKHYTAFSPITDLQLTFHSKLIIFKAGKRSSKAFSFGLHSDSGDLSAPIISLLLSTFSTIGLATLKTLTLNHSIKDAHAKSFTEFILALVSVEELKSSIFPLIPLHDVLLLSNAVALPRLKAIHLDCTYGLDQLSRIAELVHGRMELGVPLETLTLEVRSSTSADEEIQTFRNAVGDVNIQIIITTY